MEAASIVGSYRIRPSSDGTFRLFGLAGVLYHDAPHFATIDEAKAAAQADYEARILSALATPTAANASEGDAAL